MLRKFTLGLIAAASLSFAALAPGAASAHGFHGGWGHGGWGHGGGFGFGGLYINTGVSDCYQQQLVQTRYGMRVRTINVCAYNVY
jgi:Spy/CpxP family protein refolding chaperone